MVETLLFFSSCHLTGAKIMRAAGVKDAALMIFAHLREGEMKRREEEKKRRREEERKRRREEEKIPMSKEMSGSWEAH